MNALFSRIHHHVFVAYRKQLSIVLSIPIEYEHSNPIFFPKHLIRQTLQVWKFHIINADNNVTVLPQKLPRQRQSADTSWRAKPSGCGRSFPLAT